MKPSSVDTYDRTKADEYYKEHSLDEVQGHATKARLISDFPVSAYTPKIQLSFWTPPGQCPRKVEIER